MHKKIFKFDTCNHEKIITNVYKHTICSNLPNQIAVLTIKLDKVDCVKMNKLEVGDVINDVLNHLGLTMENTDYLRINYSRVTLDQIPVQFKLEDVIARLPHYLILKNVA